MDFTDAACEHIGAKSQDYPDCPNLARPRVELEIAGNGRVLGCTAQSGDVVTST
jgi:hypothetical protein